MATKAPKHKHTKEPKKEVRSLRFFDTSAILPWLRKEQHTEKVATFFQSGEPIFVWWGTVTEAESALSRLEREHTLHAGDLASARGRLKLLQESWHEVMPTVMVKQLATRLLRTHALRSQDALQLAAALQLADGFPQDILFISFEGRLCVAAEKEGLQIL
ncbi:MAG: hypothetical protein LDLANPLL_02677 [Turneriella sp.]|nr:hypothetical protein [Turneriella sp.]